MVPRLLLRPQARVTERPCPLPVLVGHPLLRTPPVVLMLQWELVYLPLMQFPTLGGMTLLVGLWAFLKMAL